MISTIYNFRGSKSYKITIFFYYWLCYRFASKVIMLQKASQFCSVIMFYYSKHTIVRVTCQVPPPLTWHISQIVVGCLSPIVSTCVINQSCGHWLLSDALHSIISMSSKLKEKKK